MNALQGIDVLDFSFFPSAVPDSVVYAGAAHGIQVIATQSGFAEPVHGRLLVAMYAWDGNAHPGNEWSVALIALLNQIGSFVPCRRAVLPCFDSIMCRVGASDVQLRGISTFMAEMLEASCILKTATERSLVIVDELGRGTSTSDGFGLAWAIARHLVEDIRCFTLFATHFHELASLEHKTAAVRNRHATAAVDQASGRLTFLYALADGAADQSYGAYVAELAGFPARVVASARQRLVRKLAAETSLFQVTSFDDRSSEESMNPFSSLSILGKIWQGNGFSHLQLFQVLDAGLRKYGIPNLGGIQICLQCQVFSKLKDFADRVIQELPKLKLRFCLCTVSESSMSYKLLAQEDDPQASEAALRLKALLRSGGQDTTAPADSVLTILPPSSANTVLPGSVNTILPGSVATAVPLEVPLHSEPVSERALPLIFGSTLALWFFWLCSRKLEHLPEGIPAILLGLWMTFQVHKVQNFAVLVKPVLVWIWLATLPSLDRMTWWALGLQMLGALVSAIAIYLWAVAREKAPGLARSFGYCGLAISWLLALLAYLPLGWAPVTFAFPGIACWVLGFPADARAVEKADWRTWLQNVGLLLAWSFSLPVLCATGSHQLFLLLSFLVSAFRDLGDSGQFGGLGLIGLGPLHVASWGVRMLLLLLLALLPVALSSNLEDSIRWTVPDVSPAAYIEVNITQPFLHLKSHGIRWLELPQPVWPSMAEIPSHLWVPRAKYWISLMLLKYFVVLAVSAALLRIGWPYHPKDLYKPKSGAFKASTLSLEEAYERATAGAKTGKGLQEVLFFWALSDESRNLLLSVLLLCWLILCSKLTISASRGGQLSAAGMSWEAWDLLWTSQLLLFFLQALVMRFNSTCSYSAMDVALSSRTLFPFMGDGFDVVKDAMLANMVMQSEIHWVRYLGYMGLAYVWMLHFYWLWPGASGRERLDRSYLTLLFLKPREVDAPQPSLSERACQVAYVETEPSRQKAMLLEDAPQALLELLALGVTKPFPLAMNLVIPGLRLLAATQLHNSIAWRVRSWLLQEALAASGGLCPEGFGNRDRYAEALCRLQLVYGKLWESFSEELRSTAQRAAKKSKEVSFITEWVKLQELQVTKPELELFPDAPLTLRRLQPAALKAPRIASGTTCIEKCMRPVLLIDRDQSEKGLPAAKADSEVLLTVHTSSPLFLFDHGIAAVIARLRRLGPDYRKLRLTMQTFEGKRQISDISALPSQCLSALLQGLGESAYIRTVVLDLAEMYEETDPAKPFLKGLRHLVEVTELEINLRQTRMDDASCHALAESLCCLQVSQLRLDLSGNYDHRLSCRTLRISERGRSAIIESASKLHELKRFELICDLKDRYEVRDTELEEYHSKLRHIPDVRVEYAEA
ncbi:msh2 [Symbiodinium sp. CCMP2592]|nr:msh2 [Symbiodinium sp. CCMP2592]